MIAEVALALVLLIGASLFVRSFLNLQSASPGFNTAPLLTLRFCMTGEADANPEQRQQRVADIVRRIEGLPGVESVYASNFIPLGGGGGSAIVDGRAVAKGEEPNILFIGVTPHFQRTMGLPLIKGRDFSDAEVVSRTPTVIGVAPDVRQFDMTDETPMPAAFVPYPHASVIGAFGVTRVISSLLYNVTPSHPISFFAVAAFLTAIAFVASYLPARRATNVDPIVALRNE